MIIQQQDYHNPVIAGNFWNNSDRYKSLLVQEYLNEIKPYLTVIIIDLQKSSTSKVQKICQ